MSVPQAGIIDPAAIEPVKESVAFSGRISMKAIPEKAHIPVPSAGPDTVSGDEPRAPAVDLNHLFRRQTKSWEQTDSGNGRNPQTAGSVCPEFSPDADGYPAAIDRRQLQSVAVHEYSKCIHHIQNFPLPAKMTRGKTGLHVNQTPL